MINLNKNIMGIIFMTLGMFCLSVNDVSVKGLNISFPVWEVIFFRAFSGILVSFGLIFIFGWRSLKTKKPIRHFVRAFSAVGCVVFYFFGLKFLLLSENIAIVHSAPIFAALLAVPILGEKLGIHRISAIIIGFIGVIIIVKPGSDVFKLVSILPLISALFMASVYLSTRSIMNTDSSIAIIFYYSLALLITSLIFFPKDFVMPDLLQLLQLMSLGVMGSLGHYFMSQAAKHAEVVVISPFEYTSFIFVGVMGYFFYNEIPNSSIVIGGLLITLGGLYIVFRENKLDENKIKIR
jgi:drug/metabolite transporter (DMT)-like permease